ncbi:hypothetical protein [Dorea sp. AGR2135]|uniref:hypothetical protein n=1 Tax=Dorea sp. AGR2135 TaxID=1280669 RepID=UPI0003FE9209|nr:hypothetical protein [Dorea sp. AGR2135]
MYIEHPYFYEGKYYANIDGEMIEITKEVAYAMNNFYRSSKAKKLRLRTSWEFISFNERQKTVREYIKKIKISNDYVEIEYNDLLTRQ